MTRSISPRSTACSAFLAVRGEADVVAVELQVLSQSFADVFLVVDHEYGEFHGASSSSSHGSGVDAFRAAISVGNHAVLLLRDGQADDEDGTLAGLGPDASSPRRVP